MVPRDEKRGEMRGETSDAPHNETRGEACGDARSTSHGEARNEAEACDFLRQLLAFGF